MLKQDQKESQRYDNRSKGQSYTIAGLKMQASHKPKNKGRTWQLERASEQTVIYSHIHKEYGPVDR